MKLPPVLKSRYAIASIAGLAVVVGVTGVVAQTVPMEPIQWDARRLQTLDRSVRALERQIRGRNEQGQPFLVEPDPDVVALQGRVGLMDRRLQDLEATVQRVNGDLERLTVQLDESQRANTTLTTRLRTAESDIERLRAVPTPTTVQPPAAQPTTPAAPASTAAADLTAARAVSGAGAVAALEEVIADWPNTPQALEAEWRIGDIRRAAGDQGAAVQAYARALRGWPTQPWAGEVTLKLARGLNRTNRKPAACQALSEFDRRYRAGASEDLRGVATTVRGEVGTCS